MHLVLGRSQVYPFGRVPGVADERRARIRLRRREIRLALATIATFGRLAS